MSREWKPGDVASVECSDGEWRQATCEPHPNYPGIGVWRFPDRVYRHVDDSAARPLAVIDPEDEAQIERLAEIYTDRRVNPNIAAIKGMAADRLRNALREFADPKPPKPEEPTGLGAVVRDANGCKHVRTFHSGVRQAWLGYIGNDGGERARRYEDIDAVDVLSEGVTL